MKNKEIVSYMAANGHKYLIAVVKPEDKLGVLLSLTPAGKLNKYDGKSAGAKFEAWGQIVYENGVATRVPFGG